LKHLTQQKKKASGARSLKEKNSYTKPQNHILLNNKPQLILQK